MKVGCEMTEQTIIEEKIVQMKKPGRRLLAAIDGRCAAGKTTLARRLQEELCCSVFHMDDFFLRPEQRTAERFRTPGENVDHERFFEEILKPLKQGEEWITYRAFDCHKQALKAPVYLRAEDIVIVEGAYSCHPSLWDSYDLHFFMDIDPEEQKKRILERNGPEGWKAFSTRWIPLEEQYIQSVIGDRKFIQLP